MTPRQLGIRTRGTLVRDAIKPTFRIGFVVAASCLGPPLSPAQTTQGSQLQASATVRGSTYRIANAAIEGTVSVQGGRLTGLHINDLVHGRGITFQDVFQLTLADGDNSKSSVLSFSAPPVVETLSAVPSSTREAEHAPGKQLCVAFQAEPQIAAHWCLVLRDGSAYLRQTLRLTAGSESAPIDQVRLLDFPDAGAHVAGTVAGSPVVDDGAFFAFEHPMAKSSVVAGHVVASIYRVLPLQAGQTVTYSSVLGFNAPGQQRRTFLAYLERERIHPYRPFLTYNSWYDLAFGERYTEAGALNRVNAFGEELARKRHVQMDSFLFDDGWDNTGSLWQFNADFPHGMANVSAEASAFHAGVGMWLSPWGGYDEAKEARIAYGRQHGYEIVRNGYALSGPVYYDAFEKVCLDLVRKYGVNQFKFDGTGNADQVFPGSAYDSDFDAAIHLMDRLREQKPDLFINLTTGTYPSPFWLEYADCIWRGGEDHSFAGVGSWRQKWITYRDGQTYQNIVRGGPLYPLNSLMLHSVIYAQKAEHLGNTPDRPATADVDFADEVWTFFGSGTDLQELYITPSLLNEHNWDALATAARWARNNSNTLRDSHWVGGDPTALQVYGWASWRPKEAILVLRNPSDHAQTFAIDAKSAFELPTGAALDLRLRDVNRDEREETHLQAGGPTVITLAPFQVRVLESVSN